MLICLHIYLYMCRCTYICVDLYIGINMIVSCLSIYGHIIHVCVLHDCVQRCEDTVNVELRHINQGSHQENVKIPES